MNNNRRNGISVISGNAVIIDHPIISNTNGVAPMCGIDIEPNNINCRIENLRIINPYTYNNKGYGISIGLSKLQSTKFKSVGVEIDNHLDDFSECGFYLGGYNLNLNLYLWEGILSY
ncbi:hypothetical protein FSB73_22040 [Arachidicoccus ginsenosidivorans]|uniref:Uncharacterized protein n=1 Tax=Arachidicoccus ginsenosidivorans TaxID=496057 RepID=A0A5B8VR91_9BACT|nr:hypothetical protein [Arachidicoccus ginsenosidivorans]QEC73949.1 hypothetical protein FSB73_22040 [Arachidicoccus ginsenosidivorans]